VRHWFKRNGERLPILIATRPPLVHALPGSGWTSGVVSEADQKTVRRTVFPTNALALMGQTELKLDPHSGVTVVFRSRRGDRLKTLVWVSHGGATGSSGHGARPAWRKTGMVLICKVLEQGNFAWVKTAPERINPSSGRIEGTRAQRWGCRMAQCGDSRAQFEALFEGVRRTRKQSGFEQQGFDRGDQIPCEWFSRRKLRRMMAQRVAAPTAAG